MLEGIDIGLSQHLAAGTLIGEREAWSVTYGIGIANDAIRQQLETSNARRVFIVTSPAVRRSPAFALLETSLGQRLAGCFDEVEPHVPRECALAAAQSFRSVGADAIVSIGGGSTTDAAKAVRLIVSLGLQTTHDFDHLPAEARLVDVDHIAVPTTLSGAEFSSSIGITDSVRRLKHPVHQYSVTPARVVLDPQITMGSPRSIWVPGLLKVLSDTVEVLTARDLNPIFEPLALQAVRFLIVSSNNLDDAQGRLLAQIASWSTVFTIKHSRSQLGLATALRHALGPHLGPAHGLVSTIMLPHAYRFCASDVPEERHRRIAEALALPEDPEPGQAVTAHLAALVARSGAPSRLGQIGADPDILERVLPQIREELRRSASFCRNVSDESIRVLFRSAL